MIAPYGGIPEQKHPGGHITEYNRLQHLVRDRAIIHKPVTLSSGLKSDIYIDAKQITLHPKGSYLIGEVIYDIIRTWPVVGIGGRTLGADPISSAVMHTAYRYGYLINQFIVRKEPKDHGISRWIDGLVNPNDKVVLVDDVVTTGQSMIRTIQHVRDYGLVIVGVIVLVDRQEYGGMSTIRRAINNPKVPIIALFDRDGNMLW